MSPHLSTKDVRQIEEGGFEITDIFGRGEEGWCVKIRTSEKMKFRIFSELISYVISIYFDYKIEYFYREKPLHLNAVVQTLTRRTNYYQELNCRG